ncbi:MAG TPA: DUF1585 domain-containing protein, partial [Sorangium sp.]|nr:DUF1585 domain-containing protein [Sorangium sp.]
ALMEAARSGTCPSEQLFSYALRRRPSGDDRTRIKDITARWSGGTIADLVKQVVIGEAFRLRAKGEAR